MARKYSRDNRGRFASVGATARGGRLRTASGKKRETQTAKLSGGGPKGTVGKPKGLKPGAIKPRAAAPPKGSAAAVKIEWAQGRSAVLGKQKDSLNKQLREVNAKIKEAGPSAGAYRLQKLQIQSRLSETRRDLRQSQSAARGDTASVNRPMAGARGRALNAEITRNVNATKAQARSADKARNRQFKSDQSRAKKLRDVHLGPLATGYSQRSGRNVDEVKRRISAMEPKAQIQLFRQYVKENRVAKPAAAKPGATATKLGPRINPANKANRAATKKFNQAYERENRIRRSLFQGNKTLATRQAIANELNKASNVTATMQQQRREVRARFDVQTRSKVLKVAGSRRPGTISKNKDVRNAINRREAFKRKVNRAGALSRPGSDRKAQRTAQVRAKAMATYQGTRRPELADSTVGRFGKSRTSNAFRAPASRLASPSKTARRQGRALAIAQKPIRDQFGRRIGNPKKQQRSKTIGARATKFYQNPKATAQSVLRDRGNRGLSIRGFRMPRAIGRG